MRNLLKPVLAIFLMPVIAAGFLPCAFAGELPFALETARYRTLADEQRFDGVVEAVHRSTISAQTSGEIIELPYDVNDFVPRGAVIVRLDDTRQKAVLDKAVASEAEARARLTEAESRYRRNQRLIKENAVSKSQLEKSEADLKTARAQLELARAALKEARKQWEYTVVRAPYAGVVVERFVEIGEQVQVGTPLGTGLSLDRLRVSVEVPASYIDPIRSSMSGRVQIPGRDGQWMAFTKITIFPYADPDSHSFTIRGELPEGQHGLYPGILVKVAFGVGRQERLVVPKNAVVFRSEVTGVYVASDDGQVHFRQIRVGRDGPDGTVVVLAGLDDGERIAADPIAAGIYLKKQQLPGTGHE